MEKGVSPINTLNHKYETMPPLQVGYSKQTSKTYTFSGIIFLTIPGPFPTIPDHNTVRPVYSVYSV